MRTAYYVHQGTFCTSAGTLIRPGLLSHPNAHCMRTVQSMMQSCSTSCDMFRPTDQPACPSAACLPTSFTCTCLSKCGRAIHGWWLATRMWRAMHFGHLATNVGCAALGKLCMLMQWSIGKKVWVTYPTVCSGTAGWTATQSSISPLMRHKSKRGHGPVDYQS